MTSAVYNGLWPKIRALVLARDAYQCQLRLTGCKGRATQVDHIVGIRQGGEPWNPNNLRASCRACNVAKGNIENPRPSGKRFQRTPSRKW